jgi:hypothetical protein
VHARKSSPLGRLRRAVARLLLRVLVFAAVGVAGFLWVMGGLAPAAARLLQPDVTTWPAGDTIRRTGLAVIARRPLSPDSLKPLVRLAHTLPPDDEIWPHVLDAGARVLGRPLNPATPAASLAQLDEAAAAAVRTTLGPLGVLEWWAIDPFFVTWLDQMTGTDPSRAAALFNGIGSREGLPTAEWYLTEIGRAFVDPRPVPFVLIADTNGRQWAPKAYPPDQVPPAARRIDADTLGEALIVGLWSLVDDRPESPTVDVVGWWAPIAKARGLPSPAPRPPTP